MVKTINEPVLKKTWATGWKIIFPFIINMTMTLAVNLLNQLIDEIGENEKHPLFSLLEVLGIVIENYEAEHYKWEDASGVDVLKYLMEEHSLNQNDLPEIGSQGGYVS